MKYKFKLPDFPYSDFEIETSMWTGKSKLYMDNKPVEQSDSHGNPFIIPKDDGSYVKAFAKRSLPDFNFKVEIRGKEIIISEKLNWFQYVLGGLPLLLIFAGGLIGGGIGGAGTYINYNIFSQEGNAIGKYIKVIGVVIGTYFFYFLLYYLFMGQE